MKHQIGDLVEFKKFIPRYPLFSRNHCVEETSHRAHRRFGLHLQRILRLNSLGIILSCEDHKNLFESDSTEDDNGYVWFSQEESGEFFVYENELVKE